MLLLALCSGMAAGGAFAQQAGLSSAGNRDRVFANLRTGDSSDDVLSYRGYGYAMTDSTDGRGNIVWHPNLDWNLCSVCFCAVSCAFVPNTFQTQQKKKKEQSKRMMWVVPNFAAVSSDTQLPPLSTKGKFQLATDDSFDYSSFIWTGVVAAQSYGLDSDPELGQGFVGYTRYYWRAFADGVSGTFFTEAIVPSVTHEDPRYYTLGHGGFFRRTVYALSRTVLTKTDSGGTSFNWSEVGGNLLEASLSNAYYPPQERGLNQTARNWGTQMESAALNNVAKEFWPDIRQALTRLFK